MSCLQLILIAIMFTQPHPQPKKARYIAKKICKYSESRNLDPFMVVALIKHESSFNNRLVSKTYDYGLMQLNRRYFKGGCNLLNIECNIKKGTLFLYKLRRKYKGRRIYWLRRYNWNSPKHYLRVLWLTKAYKVALYKPYIYKIIRSGKYRKLHLFYKCIKNLCIGENKWFGSLMKREQNY